MIYRLIPAVLLAFLLASCVNTPERRIEHYPELYNRLSAADKQAVQQHQIKEGMSKDAVFFVWGRPSRTSSGMREGKHFERWTYMDLQPVYTSGFGWGYGGRHGHCYDPFYYGGPTIDYIPVPGPSVEFVNGRVSGFLVPRN